MTEMLKGNYAVPRPVTAPEPAKESLTDQMEAAALKKLGGSVTFVKKTESPVWRGEKK